MSITASDHDTVAMAKEFELLQTALRRAVAASTCDLTREALVRQVASQLGRWDGDVRLALKRMTVEEDRASGAIRSIKD